jgi:hypothetical protein
MALIREGSTRHVRRLADGLGGMHLQGGRLVLRLHQVERGLRAEIAGPDLGDPIRVRLLDRPFRQRRDKTAEPLREPAHDGVCERDCPFAPRRAHELHGIVDHCMHGQLGPCQLIRPQAEGRAHGRVELAHGSLAELLDPEVQRPRALHRAVRQPLRERPVPFVETLDRRRKRTVGVRVLFEDPPNHLERGPPRRCDHRTPRRNSS